VLQEAQLQQQQQLEVLEAAAAALQEVVQDLNLFASSLAWRLSHHMHQLLL
jgi:hypothetical protein